MSFCYHRNNLSHNLWATNTCKIKVFCAPRSNFYLLWDGITHIEDAWSRRFLYSKSLTYKPSSCECSKVWTCIQFHQGTRTCAINIRCEWHCNLSSVSYCWRSFSSTVSHLLSLLQSVTLLACSLAVTPGCQLLCSSAGLYKVLLLLFSRSVVSDSLQPHGLHHAKFLCPSPSQRARSNSCPSSWWCHPAISSSVVPFSSCPESLPASESFPMSQLFTWCGQNTGVSALASFLPKNTQDWSPLQYPNIDVLFINFNSRYYIYMGVFFLRNRKTYLEMVLLLSF